MNGACGLYFAQIAKLVGRFNLLGVPCLLSEDSSAAQVRGQNCIWLLCVIMIDLQFGVHIQSILRRQVRSITHLSLLSNG